jgi:hypothetical protein
MSDIDYVFNAEWFEKNYRANPYQFQYIPKGSAIIIDTAHQFAPDFKNFFVQLEPEVIKPQEQYLIENHDKYTYIITYNENVLKACPNARRYFYGTTWIKPSIYETHDTTRKRFQISHIAGSKKINNAPGHILRQIIHHSQPKLRDFPITFFRSGNQRPLIADHGGNPILGEEKTALFEKYQYAFVTENNRTPNYFTEKLIDCLLMKTIPIYYGAPNISSIFDTTGWILLETGSIKEIQEKMATLRPTSYADSYSVVLKNYQTALSYNDVYKNIDIALRPSGSEST